MKEVRISKITFAPIDAKDFCGYRTVGYGYMLDAHWRTANTPQEHALLVEMELEYLSGLAKLQQRIRHKYTSILEKLDVSEPLDPSADDEQVALEEKHHREHAEEWNKVRHLYYT